MKVLVWLLLCGLVGCGERSESMSAAASAKGSAAAPQNASTSVPTQNPFGANATAQAQGRSGGDFQSIPTLNEPETERAPDGKGRRKGDGGFDKPSILVAVASPLKGEVSDADLRAAVDAKADAMSRCLNADTVVEASIKVMPSGDITDVSITKIQPDEPIVRDCVASILRSARVQNVRGGEPTAISIKLLLKRGGLR